MKKIDQIEKRQDVEGKAIWQSIRTLQRRFLESDLKGFKNEQS
jgi:hypothetical protein